MPGITTAHTMTAEVEHHSLRASQQNSISLMERTLLEYSFQCIEQ